MRFVVWLPATFCEIRERSAAAGVFKFFQFLQSCQTERFCCCNLRKNNSNSFNFVSSNVYFNIFQYYDFLQDGGDVRHCGGVGERRDAAHPRAFQTFLKSLYKKQTILLLQLGKNNSKSSKCIHFRQNFKYCSGARAGWEPQASLHLERHHHHQVAIFFKILTFSYVFFVQEQHFDDKEQLFLQFQTFVAGLQVQDLWRHPEEPVRAVPPPGEFLVGRIVFNCVGTFSSTKCSTFHCFWIFLSVKVPGRVDRADAALPALPHVLLLHDPPAGAAAGWKKVFFVFVVFATFWR